MTLEFPTEFWSDSCEPASLARAIANGATGATSNPVIVLQAIEADKPRWLATARAIVQERPTWTEELIAWELIRRSSAEGAELLLPVFERTRGRGGRQSVQVNPRNFVDAEAMIGQAEQLAAIRPNIAIKLPAVAAGIEAIEELTARGIVINATVSYTVAQAIAVAEALERGLDRAKASGHDVDAMTPWVTIMVGRLEDHLRDVAAERGIDLAPERPAQASIAVFRAAYRLFVQRGYRATLLAAAMRGTHHWAEFIGGRCVITIPPSWQEKFDASPIELRSRIDEPIDPAVVADLSAKLPDFELAYREHAMTDRDFVRFGATRKTLHQFIGGYEQLLTFVRSVMLPL
jgi:transaldolase